MHCIYVYLCGYVVDIVVVDTRWSAVPTLPNQHGCGAQNVYCVRACAWSGKWGGKEVLFLRIPAVTWTFFLFQKIFKKKKTTLDFSKYQQREETSVKWRSESLAIPCFFFPLTTFPFFFPHACYI